MKNVLIITYWSYPDALIQTYTLPYVRIIKKELPAGSSIYLLTLEKDKNTITNPRRSEIDVSLSNEGINWLPFKYKPFGISAFFLWIGISVKLCSLIVRKKISVIHCWCTPPGAIGFFLSVILNRKLVIDSYEPHAEAMVENGTWKKTGVAYRILFWLERKQTERADFIISATKGMHGYAKSRYNVDIKNFLVKPACVDTGLFNIQDSPDESLRQQLGLENKIVCVYAGKFGGIYLEDEVFAFVKTAIEHWGASFRFLILTSHSKVEIEGYCNRAGVDIDHIIMRFVSHHEVPKYMKLANFALTPVKPVFTKRFCTPIKDGEYWALGLPVVIPANISDDSDIIRDNGIGSVLDVLNQETYKKSILEIENIMTQPEIGQKINTVALRYRNFSVAEQVYHSVYSVI